MLRVYVTFALFITFFSLFGQHTISGKVFDCENQRPIAEALIEVQGLKISVLSDKNGDFSLSNLPTGTHHLYVSKDGYKSFFSSVKIKNSDVNHLLSICKDKEIEIGEITVTATRSDQKLKNVPIAVHVITKSEIEKSQSVDFQSFLESEFSGINFTYDGGSPNINMMGFGGKYVLFLIDGERMAGETFDNVDYQRIDLDNIERIEIIKGASSSLYGSNAIGGVINIITKKTQNPLEINAGYIYDTNVDHRANLSVGTKQKWGSLRLSSFYKTREPYVLEDSEKRKLFYADGTIKEMPLDRIHIAGFTNYGISPKAKWILSPKWDLELSPSYYFSERNDGTEAAKKVFDRYRNYALSFKSNYQFSENESIKLSGIYDRYGKYSFYRLLDEEEKKYQNTVMRIGAQYNNLLFGKHTFVAGGEALTDELVSLRFNDEGTEASENSQNYTLFTQQDWVLSDRFTLVTGARLDYHSLFKEHFTFRLSGMYKINDFTLRGGYASGFRSPTIKELYTNWFHPWGGGFQISGNTALLPELSNNFNFSVDYNRKKLNITAMTQYSVVTDKIDIVWSDAKDALNYVNFSGKTRVIGSEISVAYRLHQSFRVRGSYSFYDIQKRVSDNRPHTLTLKAEYVAPADLLYVPSVVLSGKYVSSTQIHSTEESNTTDDYFTYYEPYWLWRLQTSVKLPYHLTFSAGITNLFDYKANVVGFYSSITPGRTFYFGLKFDY